jgi:hypothetical protein
MTLNDQEVLLIMALTEGELLDYVMESPEYLSDGYYSIFGNAIWARWQELRA